MNLVLVFLGIVLVVILYYFLNTGGTTVLSNKLDLSIDQTEIPISKISLCRRGHSQIFCSA